MSKIGSVQEHLYEPTELMQDRSSFGVTADGMSVFIDWPMISMALPSRPCFFTKASEQMIAAAAPSLVGENCSLVSGS